MLFNKRFKIPIKHPCLLSRWRGFVEAGASGAETIDYLITDHSDLMTQTEWANIRGTGPDAISKTVTT